MGGNFISGALSSPLLLLLFGAVATLVEGVLRFTHESPIEDVRVAYFVLLASA
jgi:hypothetical protein